MQSRPSYHRHRFPPEIISHAVWLYPSLPRPAATDEPGALDQPRRHLAKVSSCPLLGLEYFHGYLDRYSAKKQMRKGSRGLCPHCARPHHHPIIPLPLASRALLQMDQATFAYQSLLRNLRECRQNPDLDCYLHLRPRRYSQETSQTGAESLHNSTDSQPDRFRENHCYSSTYKFQLQKRATRTM